MPVKRRLNKAYSIDDMHFEDLFYGPGTCLFNGCGYLGDHGDGNLTDKTPEVQAIIMQTMREDWQRFQAKIMAAWAARTEHDIDIAKRFHGDPAEPWAQIEFGDPT